MTGSGGIYRATVGEVRGGTFGMLLKMLFGWYFCMELRYGDVGGSLDQ